MNHIVIKLLYTESIEIVNIEDTKIYKGHIMQVRISRALGKIIALSLISLTITMASANINENYENINNNYATMSTAELEKVVENMSLKGEVPLDMGLELMKRWTNES